MLNMKFGLKKGVRKYSQYYVYKPIVRRNLQVTEIVTVKTQKEEINNSAIFKVFYTISQLGGLYAFLVCLIGFFMIPITRKVLVFEAVKDLKQFNEKEINKMMKKENQRNEQEDVDFQNFERENESSNTKSYSFSELLEYIFSCKNNENEGISVEVNSLSQNRDLLNISTSLNVIEYKLKSIENSLYQQKVAKMMKLTELREHRMRQELSNQKETVQARVNPSTGQVQRIQNSTVEGGVQSIIQPGREQYVQQVPQQVLQQIPQQVPSNVDPNNQSYAQHIQKQHFQLQQHNVLQFEKPQPQYIQQNPVNLQQVVQQQPINQVNNYNNTEVQRKENQGSISQLLEGMGISEMNENDPAKKNLKKSTFKDMTEEEEKNAMINDQMKGVYQYANQSSFHFE